LIEPSAVALLAAVRDHFQKLIVGPQKQAAPFGAEESIQSRVGSSAWTYQRAAITHMVR
jgi:hypothetical protein